MQALSGLDLRQLGALLGSFAVPIIPVTEGQSLFSSAKPNFKRGTING